MPFLIHSSHSELVFSETQVFKEMQPLSSLGLCCLTRGLEGGVWGWDPRPFLIWTNTNPEGVPPLTRASVRVSVAPTTLCQDPQTGGGTQSVLRLMHPREKSIGSHHLGQSEKKQVALGAPSPRLTLP